MTNLALKRGRPKAASTKAKEKALAGDTKDKIQCSACTEMKRTTEMFKSYNPMHKSGFLPYCKSCFKAMCFDEVGNLSPDRMKKALQQVDRPFLIELYKNATECTGDKVGNYMKDIGLPQYKDLNYGNSIFETHEMSLEGLSYEGLGKDVTNRWKGYSPEDVVILEEFYQSMKVDNRIETVQDETYLKKLAVINLEQDKAGQRGEWGNYDKLGSMFSKFMADAKLRKSDQTEADRSGGLKNFGMIYNEVESDDWIPPWSHYAKINGAKQDIVDKTIMYIMNFALRTNKIERLTMPPMDTPKMVIDEIDEHAIMNEIFPSVEDDMVDELEEGEEIGIT